MSAAGEQVWQTKHEITKEYDIENPSPFVADNKIVFSTQYAKKYEDWSGICIYDEEDDRR